MEPVDLIARCRRGDAGAWDELFDEHYEPACRFIFQLMPDFTREDVQEAAQETFLSVIKNLGGFEGQSALQTWIFRIAANKARDLGDRMRAAKRGGGAKPLSLDAEDPATGLSIEPVASVPDPAEVLARSERSQIVRQALDRLGDPCREILELRYFGDLSYEEIAASLGLNPKTVSSRLSKCLDKFEALARSMQMGETEGIVPSNQEHA